MEDLRVLALDLAALVARRLSPLGPCGDGPTEASGLSIKMAAIPHVAIAHEGSLASTSRSELNVFIVPPIIFRTDEKRTVV